MLPKALFRVRPVSSGDIHKTECMSQKALLPWRDHRLRQVALQTERLYSDPDEMCRTTFRLKFDLHTNECLLQSLKAAKLRRSTSQQTTPPHQFGCLLLPKALQVVDHLINNCVAK